MDANGLKARVASLTPAKFEEWTCAALIYLGWQNVKHVGGSRDRGVDVRGEWQGKRCIVQCKHYRGKLVPPGDVRGLVGTRNIHHSQRAYLITTGCFGYQCFVEIQRKPVELWDLDTLAVHLSNAAFQ